MICFLRGGKKPQKSKPNHSSGCQLLYFPRFLGCFLLGIYFHEITKEQCVWQNFIFLHVLLIAYFPVSLLYYSSKYSVVEIILSSVFNFSVYREHDYSLACLSEDFVNILDYTFKPVSNENVEVIKRDCKILVFGIHASD